MARKHRPHTPDGRYLVAGGILKRCTNPQLDDRSRRLALKQLMQARMAGNREAVTQAKVALGEAGPVWWNDGVADLSGLSPADTHYSEWWFSLTDAERESGEVERKK